MPGTVDYAEFLRSLGSAKFERLWPAQEYVLRRYDAEYREQKDVAVELPTGAGKTLIALLIAELWRRDGHKVAVLSANKTLARQMTREADELRIPAVLMEGRGEDIPARDRRDYHRANKTAIMNYWVYFNQNPVVDSADLLVMDDTHLAEHCLHSLYSVEIDRYEHQSLFADIVAELVSRYPEYRILHDALDENASHTTPPELLSFLDQIAIADRLREIVDASPLLQSDADLRFRWNRLRNSLNTANVYLSLHSIWIRPYVYPLISNAQYSQAVQRLYMSATIGEPRDLCRRLGLTRIVKIPIPNEFAETTSGRRLVVINRMEDEDIPARLEAAIIAALRRHPKSVWLCASKLEAAKMQQLVSEWLNANGFVGHQTWRLSNLGDEIEHFKRASRGHLFVGGRFDGMDFEGDECRLVVLATLPRAINTQEEFICAYLRDAGFMKRRLNQRIVQALGRCNRSADDFGIYILADKRFATHFGRESNRAGISRNIMAEIDMAEDMAEVPVEQLSRNVDSFLGGDFREYDATFRGAFSSVPSRAVGTSTDLSEDVVEQEVLAWTALFGASNYTIAAQKFETCWESAKAANVRELGAYYGWCFAKARYLESLQGLPGAREEALSILEDSIGRGGESAWFNMMRTSLNRARTHGEVTTPIVGEEYWQAVSRSFDNLLEQVGTRGARFEAWCQRLTDGLQANQHGQYQEALEKLGTLLGYDSRRPRHQTATDCRWRGIFGNCRQVITLEAKIEDSSSGTIIAQDIGQVHNQIARARSEYEPFGYTVRGVIVTHLTQLQADAESAAGAIRIIPKDVILELWQLLKQLLSEYRDSWSLDDIDARRQAAEALKRRLPDACWLVESLESEERFVAGERLLARWRTARGS